MCICFVNARMALYSTFPLHELVCLISFSHPVTVGKRPFALTLNERVQSLHRLYPREPRTLSPLST